MSFQTGQYLDEETLTTKIIDLKVHPTDLGTSDSYHEDKLLNKYLSYDKEAQILIYKAALQISIIGYGNKNYGFIRIDDKNIITLVDLFNKYNIKYLEKINAKYADDDLSVRRLLRLFRFQIKKFIIENNRPSYLWFKYADKLKTDFMTICFPGGEHMVEKKDEAEFFLETYGNLDTQFGTKFRSRLKRVFIARRILDPSYFVDKNY